MELRVEQHGHHQAHDHHDGVPGCADEPDRLVQSAEQPRAESVEHHLHPPGTLTAAFLQGLEPSGPVESLEHQSVREGGRGGEDLPGPAGG